MTGTELGVLAPVDLRLHWKNESQDFTPWLAREGNIRILADALGIELEVNAVEKGVGPFHADIVCKDATRDTWVLIENQLESTDHSHLGQLLTYSAGLDAKSVVWIAQRFTDEHRAALDWLNEITNEEISFFGVEIELWKIGDSLPAPKFNVVCQPNDWSKSVHTAKSGELTEAKRIQLEFWDAFQDAMRGSKVRCQKPQAQHWMNHAIGRSGMHLASIASFFDSESNRYSGELRVEMTIDEGDTKSLFARLQADASAIEQELGEPLTWHNPTSKRACRVYVRRTAEIEDRSKWPEYHAWLRQRLERFRIVFEPRVKLL